MLHLVLLRNNILKENKNIIRTFLINMKLKVFSFFMVLYIFASSLYAKSIVYGLFPYQEMVSGVLCIMVKHVFYPDLTEL